MSSTTASTDRPPAEPRGVIVNLTGRAARPGAGAPEGHLQGCVRRDGVIRRLRPVSSWGSGGTPGRLPGRRISGVSRCSSGQASAAVGSPGLHVAEALGHGRRQVGW
jgi:hypothetical protein